MKNESETPKEIVKYGETLFSHINNGTNSPDYPAEFILNSFSNHNNSLHLIVDCNSYKILGTSSNLEKITGLKQENYSTENILQLAQVINLESTPLSAFINLMVDSSSTQPPDTDIKAMKMVICGVNTKIGKSYKRCFIQITPFKIDDNGLPLVFFITMEVITHLLKRDAFWWSRISYQNEAKSHLLSTEHKFVPQDILSVREKDILKLVEEGLESKEISEKLFISYHTAVNHRKNMMTKTGAKDSTALIHICKMCGIL